MSTIMGMNTLEKNFSRSAPTYDRCCGVQRESAQRLLAWTDAAAPADILELGCGTGNYTALLKERFPLARIKAVDISAAMIERARGKVPGVVFEVMDARQAAGRATQDIVTANACLHWISGVEEVIARCAGMLRRGGVFTASVFGPRTFHELAGAFREAGRPFPERARTFPGREELERAINRHFGRAEFEEKEYRRSFGSLLELLRVIKLSGVKGDAGGPGFIMTPEFLRRAQKTYLEAHGAIAATFQVFFIRGHG